MVERHRVALAHDYLTQRGGAERVAEVMARAFPEAPLYTTLYDPDGTFPSISHLDVRVSPLNRFGPLRRHHRLALPFLARTVSRMRIDADVLLASSSGWAHGISCTGRKIVYCHAPARWLYQQDRYLGARREMKLSQRVRRTASTRALDVLAPRLRSWDQRAAHTADRYLVNSTVVQQAVRDAYGIEAEILPPPPALLPAGEETPLSGVEPGFWLCVARLLPYKNVDAVIEGVLGAGSGELVVVGDGPDRSRLEGLAQGSRRVHLAGRVSDPQLRWAYHHCAGLIAASYEDYGLSPLEAAAFGRPTLALRDGGFLDTVEEGSTGMFFDQPSGGVISEALRRWEPSIFDPATIERHAQSFSEARFTDRLHALVAEELARG